MKLKLALALSLLASPALAQSNPVYQSGSPATPGQVPYYISNGIIGTGATANNSPITSLGITNSNLSSFCISSQRAAVGNRQQMCFGVQDTGPAQISLQNYGSDPSETLNFNINGIIYPFPGALSTITVGTTPVNAGTPGTCLTDNGGVVGTQTCSVSSITALTGDVTATGPGSSLATLTTVNGNVGTWGSQALIPIITVNGKGLITAASNVNVGIVIGTSPIISGSAADVLYNNGGVLGNKAITTFLSAGTAISITGSTTASIACNLGTSSAPGCLQPDGTIITVSLGNITVAKATSGAFGVIEGDGSTVTLSAGVLSCTTATSSQIGCARPDNATITISGGVLTSTAAATSITVGTTTVNSGNSGYLLIDNGGTLGNVYISTLVAITSPQGRLTLKSATPVMITSQATESVIYYDCFHGNSVPVWNGSNDVVLAIGSCEISTAMENTGTGVINGSGVFDVWAVNVSGTLTLCIATNGSGGGWASDSGGSNTARGSGYTQLDYVTRPYVTNKNALSNCYNASTNEGSISANQATHLGTIGTDAAAGSVTWQYGVTGAPPTAAIFNVWNRYNQVRVSTQFGDSTASWTYTTASTWREIHGDSAAVVKYTVGDAYDTLDAEYNALNSSNAPNCESEIGVDSTTANSAAPGFNQSAAAAIMPAFWKGLPGTGQHVIAPLEWTSGSTCTFYGTVSGSVSFQSAVLVTLPGM